VLNLRELIRWHLIGTPFASAVMTFVIAWSDHANGHGGTAMDYVGAFALLCGVFLLLAPIVIGVLSLWRSCARRRPALETRVSVRLMGLTILSWVVAAVINALGWILSSVALHFSNGEPLPHLDYYLLSRLFETQLYLLPAFCALVFVPRLLFRIQPLGSQFLRQEGQRSELAPAAINPIA
jgi:MFS superfamily sulfate permease-like transporter